MLTFRRALFSAALPLVTVRGAAQEPRPTPFPVTIRVDASQSKGELKPVARFFGADEPNYATMKDGRKLIGELGQLGGAQAYFRAHNLLSTGDGTPALKWGSTNIYTEDARGQPVYDFSIVDRIFETYLARGVKPYAQIGFMPQALSVHPDPYQHQWRPGLPYEEVYTGWAYPPKDYGKWSALVYEWVKHCVEKFGRNEVEQWYWEVWNEPNIGYWRGTPEEFHKLHDYAIAAVRRALPTARVGGPDVAGSGGKFMQDFLEHTLRGTNYATGETGTPLDFVSFHAKGSPSFVDGHVRMGIAAQLRTIDQGFARVASFPELKSKPIVIGESDPDGCAACQGPQLGYRNGTMFSSYTAAVFARKHLLADRHGVNFLGALTWAFEFEDQPYFAGFRALATNGIDLPVLNVFRMMAKLTGQRVAVESSADLGVDAIMRDGVRGAPDVSALASLAPGRSAIMVWHYHDDDVAGPDADVRLTVNGLPITAGEVRLTHYRIDGSHSNAYTEWKRLGSPIAPTRPQYERLEQAGQLARLDEPPVVRVENRTAAMSFALPRQGVSLIVLEWATAGTIPIRIETALGNIDAELDSAHAPITVTNFLKYVDARLYDSASFFRTVTMGNQPNDSVKIQVIQGGKARGKAGFPAIPLERTSVTGLRHRNGTLSMARSGPDTGTDQFSIMIGDQPELDFGGKRNKDGQGFAAFGQVTSGWDVITKIQAQPANGQYMTTPVTILRIVRR